jgi:hypothetical protein
MKTFHTKSGRAWLLCTMLCCGFYTPVDAARVHLKGDITFEDLGTNIETCLSLAGLGNKDITIIVTATGTASVTYINPGGNVPAGHNKYPVTAVALETVPSRQMKNGTVSVCLTSADIAVAPAPNPNWSVELDDIEFDTATVTVIQRGRVVLKKTVQL